MDKTWRERIADAEINGFTDLDRTHIVSPQHCMIGEVAGANGLEYCELSERIDKTLYPHPAFPAVRYLSMDAEAVAMWAVLTGNNTKVASQILDIIEDEALVLKREKAAA